MNEFVDEAFKEQKKSVFKFLTKLPKIVKWALFTIYTLLVFFGGRISRNFSFNLNVISQSGKNTVQVGTVEGDATINYGVNSCPVKFCSNFKDGSWEYIERFIKIQDDPLILKSPNSAALPGATMFYKEDVGNFTAEAFITPEATTSANLAVAWGHLIRCIIGDGDYTKISCQVNEAHPKEIETWSYIDKDGQLHGRHEQHQLSPFSPGKELQVKFEIQKINNITMLRIKLNDHVPLEWQLPKAYEGRTQREKVGIGLFTTNFDDVEAVFKRFQLDPHL
jgi:hypothetical protein